MLSMGLPLPSMLIKIPSCMGIPVGCRSCGNIHCSDPVSKFPTDPIGCTYPKIPSHINRTTTQHNCNDTHPIEFSS